MLPREVITSPYGINGTVYPDCVIASSRIAKQRDNTYDDCITITGHDRDIMQKFMSEIFLTRNLCFIFEASLLYSLLQIKFY